MTKHSLSLALSALLLGGCVSFAPDYQRPQAPVPATLGQPGAQGAATLDQVAWRDFFADERLRQLVGLALENNRDLRVSALNIERARAQYQIQRADLFPTIGITGSGTAQRLPGDLTATGEPAISRQYSVGVGFSSYELDFFGRIRSLRDVALENYLATEEAQRSARISLVAEVANAWFTLAADRERLKLARETLESRKSSYDLTRRSFEAGVSSAQDALQARTSLESARADVATYSAQVAQDQNALRLIVGAEVSAGLLPEQLSLEVTRMAELPAGLSSELLQQRPDILQSERSLRAANANIGAARAAYFPSITLTGSAGTASASLGGLFESGSGTWSFMPQINLPIFDMGRRSANVEVAEADRDIAIAQYERAVQSAFREVADVLAERATLGERLDARGEQTAASSESLKLADIRYRSGVDSYLSVLDAQRTLYASQLELIAARAAQASNTVNLYKVFGGGWQ
ncbi:AdeC/AdeK/OprM family multidrug efflux complex outer membrane factor [Azoarcus indigens]|uniref:Multidrug efflux system outer membrane protein n=1 Tax=Azoarcus indigens TaxID=29545 RepID=A0A4R6DL95_9RHOO|nr:AdeC/AdeK/OprM family multidrug efflux complex outer membrane factor [Azoarcus indigens]NMG66148.1 AdeC/AdeK/OprM family multidrug efflux complex outer membrane factor [Azoarcus indigens]TDN45567.1 multidrug efflux system outer membrane protein [Azoarcus indigens]